MVYIVKTGNKLIILINYFSHYLKPLKIQYFFLKIDTKNKGVFQLKINLAIISFIKLPIRWSNIIKL